MKNLLFATLLLCGCYLFLPSCSKSSARPPANPDTTTPPTQPDSTGLVAADSVIAKWTLVEDTVANTNNYFIDEGGFPYYPASGNYTGGAGDYLNLQAGGIYTGSENGVTGGGTYQLLQTRGISISSRPALADAKITALTDTTLTISGSATSINGGTLTETLYLKK